MSGGVGVWHVGVSRGWIFCRGKGGTEGQG